MEVIAMFAAFIIITVLTIVANTYAAIVDFRRPQWVLDNVAKWGGSHSWLFPLGALKAAGALGLLMGIGVPLLGIAAAVGLILFFVGATTVVIRAGWYSHLRWPGTYLLLAVASLVLRLAVS
jgi:DoxX-like family